MTKSQKIYKALAKTARQVKAEGGAIIGGTFGLAGYNEEFWRYRENNKACPVGHFLVRNNVPSLGRGACNSFGELFDLSHDAVQAIAAGFDGTDKDKSCASTFPDMYRIGQRLRKIYG